MIITKKTVPDAILFRFDPDSDKPVIRGAAYYDRTVVTEDGVVISSKENDAQPVSIAAGVKGLDLSVILGTLAAGQQAAMDELTDKLKANEAEMKAKDANVQDLLGQLNDVTSERDRYKTIADSFTPAEATEPEAKE